MTHCKSLHTPGKLVLSMVVLLSCVSMALGQELLFENEVPPPDSAGFDVFLILGQSNAQGYQEYPEWIASDYDTVPNFYRYYDSPNDVHVVRIVGGEFLTRTETGWWKAGVEPVGPKGVCMGRGCAKVLVQNAPDQPVGIGVCAKGATSITEWQKGEWCYDASMAAAAEIMAYGTLRAILWHQGENDRNNTNPTFWQEHLKATIANLRADLGLPHLPFVIGELGRFASNCDNINNQIPQIINDVPNTAMVSSEGLISTGDDLHFASASQRILGERYGEALLPLLAATPVANSATRLPRQSGSFRVSRATNGTYVFSAASQMSQLSVNVYTLGGAMVATRSGRGSVVWSSAAPGLYAARVASEAGGSESMTLRVLR